MAKRRCYCYYFSVAFFGKKKQVQWYYRLTKPQMRNRYLFIYSFSGKNSFSPYSPRSAATAAESSCAHAKSQISVVIIIIIIFFFSRIHRVLYTYLHAHLRRSCGLENGPLWPRIHWYNAIYHFCAHRTHINIL